MIDQLIVLMSGHQYFIARTNWQTINQIGQKEGALGCLCIQKGNNLKNHEQAEQMLYLRIIPQ
jgi:hypothetical protein